MTELHAHIRFLEQGSPYKSIFNREISAGLIFKRGKIGQTVMRTDLVDKQNLGTQGQTKKGKLENGLFKKNTAHGHFGALS